ncbi:MAG: substrate-binding domain-containing protein [Thermomicrobiales bacterium]|nr:substrate-binding domain-containing protein [Thermomicrobiales bacterium]
MSISERCGAKASRRTIVKAGAGMTLAATLFGAGHLGTAARQDKTYRIAFIQGVIGDNFYITMDCGARAMADALGNITIETQGPERWGQELQTPILNAVVQSKPDAIMIAPNDTTGMIAPIKAAIDAGVPVLCVDTTIDSDIQLADVSTDNVEAGRVAARGLAEAIGEKGQVFIVNTIPGISTTDQRSQGFREEIAKFPNIEFVGEEFSNNDANQAAAIVSAKLQSDPELAGIFGTNLFSAQGAAAGVREQGKVGQVKVVSFDAGPTQVQDLKSGAADILIAQHPGDIGQIAVQLLHDFLTTGNPPDPKKYVTGATVITKENIDDPAVARYLYLSDCANYKLSDITPQEVAAPAEATPTA